MESTQDENDWITDQLEEEDHRESKGKGKKSNKSSEGGESSSSSNVYFPIYLYV